MGGAGEVNNFRHMLGLDTNPGTSNMKARTMKDSKEIMKKRRERAICIVSMRSGLVKSNKTKSEPQSIDLFSSLENPAKLNYLSFRNINIIENEYYFNKAISIFRIASREYYFPQPSFC